MFSIEEKFKYFIGIEKQINIIIRINYKSSKEKIVKKIDKLLSIQNSKSALYLELDKSDYEVNLTLYMKEFNRGLGTKTIFKTIFPIKSIIREIRLDMLLGKNM